MMNMVVKEFVFWRMKVGHWYYTVFLMNIFKRFSSILNFYSFLYFNLLTYRCNRLRCPLARLSGLQCFNMGHNGYGISLWCYYDPYEINMQVDNPA